MNKHLLLSLCGLLLFLSLAAQKSPKRELRGAWITTHLGLDWPVKSQTVVQKQNALLAILDHHKATGMNAMYFQVRSQSDAMYPSSIEPWAAILTPGHVQGTDPGWDPLQFAITESRKRGMEFHAWINPYRAIANIDSLSRFSPQHVARQHPEWLIAGVNKERILNPGLPAVRDYLANVITDIVDRYDIDGIHFDDYFYPNAPFNDDAAYNADPRGFPATTAGRANWRRDNVNLLIKRVGDSINAAKPWVKFGVSPSGIYRNGLTVGGSATSGLEHYTTLYADTKKWIQEGWVDYLAPQVYWHIGFSIADYSKILPWWNSNAFGRHIYIGMASFKVNSSFSTTGTGPAEQAAWAQRTQYPNELRLNRLAEYNNILGEIHFRSAFLSANALGHRDSMRLNIYKRPALPPVMPWRDDTAPAAPTGLTAIKQANNSYVLSWTKPPASDNEMDKVRQFVIYRSESPVMDITDTANLIFITSTDVTTYTDANPANKTFYYTVTSVDRGYVESAPSNVTDYLPPVITCPGAQTMELNAQCSAVVPDYTTNTVVSDDVTPAASISITQSPAAGTVLTGSGVTSVTLTATDGSGKSTSCTFTITAQDKTLPAITCNEALTVSTDNGLCSALINITAPTATDNCGVVTVSGVRNDGKLLTAAYPKGTTTITWTAKDEVGNTASCTQSVTVEDREAPVISAVAADPSVLWPANHKMRNVTISYTVTDNCGVATPGSLSITSNELSTDGESDWEVINNHKVKLRAERNGNGSGRVYTITISAIDAAGNVGIQTVTVTVPHDQGNHITAPQAAGQEPAILAQGTVVTVSPNPSSTQFVITLPGGKEQSSLQVTDNLNRVMEIRRGLSPGSAVTIGANYRPGVYYIEVVQGTKRERFKIVKQ